LFLPKPIWQFLAYSFALIGTQFKTFTVVAKKHGNLPVQATAFCGFFANGNMV